jgi:hypothetical protein
MQRVPTAWKGNPAKNADTVSYSSASVLYSSAVVPYSTATTNLNDDNKVAGSWAKPADRNATPWQANPDANTSLYLYDSVAHSYDSAVDTYDGIVVSQEFTNQNAPTPWSSI